MTGPVTKTCTLAIDVGGTFTDITFTDAATGALWVAKTPSTPGDLSAGFITAVRKVLALAGRAPADVLRVFHGTTTATNAILEGKTPPTALVTTAGFKYVLEIGRHDIPRHGNLYGWSKPARPITADRVFEVRERLDVDGAVLTPLDEPGARALARQLAQLGVPAVAVVFLHAYANPAHEQRMQAILAEEYPGVLVSLSSEVLPQFREFERTMATALNAAVMPPVSRYVSVLRQALDGEGVQAPLLIMKSDGGVTSAATCIRQPVQTVLSGPAAGVVGAVSVGRSAGFADIISIDVGGTSADICLVRAGRPEITKDGMVGPFPLKLPMVDIHTIGAGGGSVAGVTSGGRLTVGGAARAPSRARCATVGAAVSPPSPTRTWSWAASRPRCWAASCRSTSRRRATRSRRASAGRSASGWRRPRRASWRSSTTRWPAPSARCRWGAATIRGGSPWWRSAAPGRSTPAGSPSCSRFPP
jgi:N-methylhydantoinase A